MKRYFNLNDNTCNNYCDDIEVSCMVEIPDDGKPYGKINDVVQDISNTDEYKIKTLAEQNAITKANLQSQIDELDKKCIRAMREPSVKDELTGQTWLEFYNSQIQDLRAQLVALA